MRVWIIGKRGMLSQAFRRKCRVRGVDYLATSRLEVNVEDESAVRAQFETLDFTHLINCSGYTAVDRAEDEEQLAYLLNVVAVERLAKLSKKHRKKLIHFSSDYVFDGEEESYREDARPAPLSIYGKTKEAGEKKLFEHYPGACLVRTSWLFGREGNDFVKKMVTLMQERESLHVVSDQRGRPTYADDLAEAVLTIIDQSGIFHFANEGAISWFEWAEIIKKKLEERNVPLRCKEIAAISTEEFGAKAARPRSSLLVTDKFVAPHWDRGLEEVLESVIKAK